MSHIEVNLKVIEGLAASTARAASVSEDRVLAGLVRLWHRVWASQADHLGRGQLAGLFGAEGLDALIGALCDFGFLEVGDEGEWRVRGAARYLRLKESRRLGAQKTNALRWGSSNERTSENERQNEGRSRVTGSDALERPGAIAPSRSPTEHRTPITVEEDLPRAETRAVKPKKAPDPRHAPLVAALVDAYTEVCGVPYAFSPRDARHVAQLLGLGEPAEVLARWRLALERSRDRFHTPKVHSLASLVKHWNAYPVAAPPAPDPGRDALKGRLTEAFNEYLAGHILTHDRAELDGDDVVVITADSFRADSLRAQLAPGALVRIEHRPSEAA